MACSILSLLLPRMTIVFAVVAVHVVAGADVVVFVVVVVVVVVRTYSIHNDLLTLSWLQSFTHVVDHK